MSTRFSHLSREPKKFNLDLTPFLESEFFETDNHGWWYFFYTDNHSEEYLIPTMVVVLNYLANNEFKKDKYYSDYNYEHFRSACLSYIESFYDHRDFEELWFFKNKYEIDDSMYLFDDNDNIIDFKIYVKNENIKKSLINLFIFLYEYWIKEYSLDKKKDLKLSKKQKIKDFLENFIVMKNIK